MPVPLSALKVLEHVHFLDLLHLVGDNGLEVLVEDFLFLVRDVLEPLEGLVQVLVGKVIPHLLEPVAEGVSAGMLAEHQVGLDEADGLRAS